MKIKKLHPDVQTPERATNGSSAFDVFSRETVTLYPGEKYKFQTGFKLELDYGWGGFLLPRSGLGTKHDIKLANDVGLVDFDYRGEVGVVLKNEGTEPHTVMQGDRICQLAIIQTYIGWIEIVEELSDTERGEGGFGSTGRQ